MASALALGRYDAHDEKYDQDFAAGVETQLSALQRQERSAARAEADEINQWINRPQTQQHPRRDHHHGGHGGDASIEREGEAIAAAIRTYAKSLASGAPLQPHPAHGAGGPSTGAPPAPAPPPSAPNDALNDALIMKELDAAIDKITSYRAAGQDGVKGEFLKYLGDAGKRALLALYNFIYAHQLCPTDWTKDVAWPIHKKGDVTDPGNYRLITLMSVTCKLFERLLNTRLTAWTTSDASQQHIAENQVGFQADRSTTDHLYATTETARMRTAHGRPTYACFVDCRKAFPSVFKAGMLVKLHRQGVRGKFWRMLQSMYSKIETRVLTGHESDLTPAELEGMYYQIETGVREGSIMSPLLYVLFIDGLLQELRSQGLGVHITHKNTLEKTWVGALMYADDLVMLADTPAELQLMMDVIAKYARKWRFQINDGKTKVMCMFETKKQQAARESNCGGSTWMCGTNVFATTQSYACTWV